MFRTTTGETTIKNEEKEIVQHRINELQQKLERLNNSEYNTYETLRQLNAEMGYRRIERSIKEYQERINNNRGKEKGLIKDYEPRIDPNNKKDVQPIIKYKLTSDHPLCNVLTLIVAESKMKNIKELSSIKDYNQLSEYIWNTFEIDIEENNDFKIETEKDEIIFQYNINETIDTFFRNVGKYKNSRNHPLVLLTIHLFGEFDEDNMMATSETRLFLKNSPLPNMEINKVTPISRFEKTQISKEYSKY